MSQAPVSDNLPRDTLDTKSVWKPKNASGPMSHSKAANLWQASTSKLIVKDRVEKKKLAFIRETKRSVTSSDSSVREDIERVIEYLRRGDINAIDALRERGRADLNAPLRHTSGECALHVAASALGDLTTRDNVIKCLIWLMDEIKVDIETVDNHGRNVLHIAANSADDREALLVLLSRGADPLTRSIASDLPSNSAHAQRHSKARGLLVEAEKETDSIKWAHEHPDMNEEFLPKRRSEMYHISQDFAKAELEAAAIDRPKSRDSQYSGGSGSGGEGDMSGGSVASSLARLIVEQSASMKWVPDKKLQVVRRARAAEEKAELLTRRRARAKDFVEQLKAKTLGPDGAQRWK